MKICFVCLVSERSTPLSVHISSSPPEQTKVMTLWRGQCRNVSLHDERALHLTITGDDGHVYFEGPLLHENNSVVVVINDKGVDMVPNSLDENKN